MPPIERMPAIDSSSSSPVRATKPRAADAVSITHSYTALAQVVRELGLLRRARWFYALLLGGLLLALAGAAVGFVLLRDSWLQLLIAGALGILFTQFAFFAHEAAHRQVIASGKANERIAQIVGGLLVGMSYSWWMNKHSRHHANPNQIGKDPDIDTKGLAFTDEGAAAQRRPWSFITKASGRLFFPLLFLEGLNLHVKSVRSLLEPGRIEGRALELSLIGSRFVIYFARAVLVPAARAWRSRSSACRSRCSACTWAHRSCRTTPAWRSSRPTTRSTSSPSRCGRRATSRADSGPACCWAG